MDEPTFYKVEDTAMRSEFLDEIGDTLFAVGVAGAIGLSAANLSHGFHFQNGRWK
jgi:hypothetical protein